MAFRRGNKSNKVPNVKLRPALPNQTRKSKTSLSYETLQHHDSGFDSEQENSFVDMRIPRPFRGVVLSATGISDKMSLFKRAIELGAQPLNDLTDIVTHLLAIEPGSEKYKCALENNIPIMHPSWVEDCYDVWLRGDDVNLAESIKQHRLPIFENVTLCLSGVVDEDTREEIIRRVEEEGGSCVENIERPVKVTHLLCTSGPDNMSERMRYAVKFNKRREADIKIVWIEWFWACLKAGGRCDEEAYAISKPRPARASTPIAASPPPCSSSPDARPNHPLRVQNSSSALDDSETKDEEEAAVPIKLAPAVTNEIWGLLLKNRGFEAKSGKLLRSPTKSRDSSRTVGNLEDTPTKPKPKRNNLERTKSGDDSEQQRSILKSLRRAQPAVSRTSSSSRLPLAAETSRPHPAGAGEPSLENVPQPGGVAGPSAKPYAGSEQSDRRTGFFTGLTFRLLGEARSPHVKSTLEEAGGRVVSESSDDPVDFIVVRLVSGSKIYRDEADENTRGRYRTECWLERCISEGRVCSADEHISFVPLAILDHIPGANDFTVSISGLEEAEACWVRRLLRALGINFAPSFSRRTTHLLCPSRNGAKHDKAQEWGIPVVGMEWLVHLIEDAHVQRSASASEPQMELKMDAKGKSRPVTTEPQITSGDSNDLGAVDQSVDDTYGESFGEPIGLLPEPQATEGTESATMQSTEDVPQSLSLAELREDMLNTHIPSSETPSPIKRPSASPSPAKISREATRVLQESITTLLGKRMSSSEDAISGQAPRPKRVRPPSRTKAASRDDVLPAPIITSREPYQPFSLDADEGDISMLAAVRAQEDDNDSIRVTYEDPVQSSERMRLMKLLETQKPPDVWELGESANAEGSRGAIPVERERAPVTRRRQPRRSARTGGM